MSRGTTAIIDFKNLRHNFKVLSQLAPDRLVLVVKADAYGHGLEQVVSALKDVDCFAVATIDEGLLIRKIQPQVKILLLEGYLDEDELALAQSNDFECVIHQHQQLDLLVESDSSKRLNIWLKYDSGMNRLGFTKNEFIQALTRLEASPQVNEIILMSHFASANIKNSPFTAEQTKRFLDLQCCYPLSLSNSSALLHGDYITQEWCRIGLALFGVSPLEGVNAQQINLKPVMTLKTNVIAIKEVGKGGYIGYSQSYCAPQDMQIAIIGIGYGDGYPWSLSRSAYVFINNQKATIIGRVSMDMLAIDISHIEKISIGDSVLIWGQECKTLLPLEKVADNALTIPYVLLCQITSRVKYQYVNQ